MTVMENRGGVSGDYGDCGGDYDKQNYSMGLCWHMTMIYL